MVKSFEFRLPKEIFFGSGLGNDTGKYLVDIGKRAVVVTGRQSTRESGVLDRVTQSLDHFGIVYSIFNRVEPEPSLITVDQGISFTKNFGCDMVISLGGGSALDCGKAIAGLLNEKDSVRSFFYGAPMTQSGIPWIALPTTAGTGSEMTSNSVITDTETGIKKSIRSFHFIARLAIIDPTFTQSMNPHLTAVSGIDALIQGIEAYTSPRSNPVSDVLALEAIDLLWKYLPRAVHDGGNLQNREYVAKGSMISAMAFANSSSGAAHGFSHLVGPKFSISHGESCAVLMPAVFRFNSEVFRQKYFNIIKQLGLSKIQDNNPAENLARAFEVLLDQIHLPKKFRDFNVDMEELLSVVAIDNIGRNIMENPRPFEKKDMIDLLKESW